MEAVGTVGPRVFLSYRREDSAAYTGRLFDTLHARLGAGVFMDVDTIAPGSDFVDAIQAALADCDVVLVMIGRVWASITDAEGRRRLDSPGDFVRLEIETALQRGIRVIPVLVGAASMPSPGELPDGLGDLARRNAVELSDQRWRSDVSQLVLAIDPAAVSAGSGNGAAAAGLVTLLYAEVEGWSAGLVERPAEMAAALVRVREIVGGVVAGAGGELYRAAGGGLGAVFAGASVAVTVAAAAQRLLGGESWPGGLAVRAAMALHSGPTLRHGDEYVGAAADRAARLVAVAHGGQVVLSGLTAELVGEDLAAGVSLRDLGEHRLRDLGRAERVFQLCGVGLDDVFPPLRSLDNPKLSHNLPEQMSSFVGRAAEVAAVVALVEAYRLVTLAGPGGVGKTRLALQASAELVDGSGDGVWFADLAPITEAALVVATVANVMMVREQAGRPVVESLIDALGDRRLLMVMDNCEQVIAPAAALTDALLRRCPRVFVVATSREPLGISGERVYRVPSLASPDPDDDDPATVAGFESVRLFMERAAQQKPGFALDADNAAIVGRLCRRLDGIPFAIELAAARLRSMSVRDLETRLEKRFKLLTGGSRTALPRQQTLQALIDFSYDLLSSLERTMLARLSVFAGGFDLAAAEAVCPGGEIDDFEILDLLDALVDKSLVQVDQSGTTVRYRLLETIREYAGAKLAERDDLERAALHGAHRDYFLGLAEEAAPHLRGVGELEWFGRLQADVDNLRAALVACLGDPDAGPGLRLAAALDEFWRARGQGVEGVAALRAQLDRPEAQAPTLLRGRALAAAAHLEFSLGGNTAAETLGKEAVDIARAHNDDALVVKAMLWRAWARYQQDDGNACLTFLNEALPVARRLGDPRAVAHLLNLLGSHLTNVGGDDRKVFEEAAQLYRQAGDRRGGAVVLANLGGSAEVAGDFEAARRAYDEAGTIFRDLNDRPNLALTFGNQGTVAYLIGDYVAADRLAHESLEMARRIGSRRIVTYAILGLALSATGTGDAHRAATLHGVFDARESPLEHPMPALRDADLSRLRRVLGEDAFDAAYQAGRALSLDDALALASRPSQATNDTAARIGQAG